MIYLDMDGPLVNFNQGLLDLLNNPIHHDELNEWDVWKCLGMPNNQAMWDVINPLGSHWWKNLKAYPWAMGLYQELKEIDDVVILTNPSWSPDACKGKLLWLQDRFGFQFEDWIFTSQKHLLAKPGDILIDDAPKNCEKFIDSEQGGCSAAWSVLFPCPWNASCDWVNRPSKVENVVQMVKNMKKHFTNRLDA